MQYSFSGLLPEPKLSKGGGGGLLPEEVCAHVGITICEKSHSEATVAMAADNCREVAARRRAVLAVANICDTVWVSWRDLFSK